MIGLKGRLSVIDNSGALIAECINVLKVKTRKKSTGFAGVGAFFDFFKGCQSQVLLEASGGEHDPLGLTYHGRSGADILKFVRKTVRAVTESTGDEIVCVINKARPTPRADLTGPGAGAGGNVQKVRRGDIRRAVVVRTRKPELRPDGRYVAYVLRDEGTAQKAETNVQIRRHRMRPPQQ
jgi:ribosomal protein L14